MEEVVSPCVRNCCLNDEEVCLGCYRHIDEIVSWRALSIEEQKQVLDNCAIRKDKPKTQGLKLKPTNCSERFQ